MIHLLAWQLNGNYIDGREAMCQLLCLALICTLLPRRNAALFLNGQLTGETEWILTSFSAKIVIRDANEIRGIVHELVT